MAKSRYFPTRVLKSSGEAKHYATWSTPLRLHGLADVDFLAGLTTFTHTWERGDRMDKLASKYFGDDEYWWIIALVNNIGYPLGIAPGTVLRVPTDITPVLELLDMV